MKSGEVVALVAVLAAAAIAWRMFASKAQPYGWDPVLKRFVGDDPL